MRPQRNPEPAQTPQSTTQTLNHGSSREPMDHIKHIADGISFGVAITTLAGWLPPIAALVSILWIGFQFYHSVPMTQWRADRKKAKDEIH